MWNIIQNLGMFCLDKIMLIFKIPKLFHFQRTLMQIHFPRSITNTDLPALPPIPAKQAGLAQAGRGPRSQKPRDSVPARTTHPQLLALPEEMPSPRPLELLPRQRGSCDGRRPRVITGFSIAPKDTAQATLCNLLQRFREATFCNWEKEGEGGILTGRVQWCYGFLWHDGAWDL